MKPMSEITSPAMESPLGRLKTPIKEKISPSNHSIQPKTGTQQRNRPRRARMKPAVPMPLDFCCSGACIIICCCAVVGFAVVGCWGVSLGFLQLLSCMVIKSNGRNCPKSFHAHRAPPSAVTREKKRTIHAHNGHERSSLVLLVVESWRFRWDENKDLSPSLCVRTAARVVNE